MFGLARCVECLSYVRALLGGPILPFKTGVIGCLGLSEIVNQTKLSQSLILSAHVYQFLGNEQSEMATMA